MMRREASDAHATKDLDLAYEMVQPDGTTDNLSLPLRRSIGLVRLIPLPGPLESKTIMRFPAHRRA